MLLAIAGGVAGGVWTYHKVDNYMTSYDVPPNTSAKFPPRAPGTPIPNAPSNMLAFITAPAIEPPAMRSRAKRIFGPPDESYKKFPLPEIKPALLNNSAAPHPLDRFSGSFSWPWGKETLPRTWTPADLSANFRWPWGQLPLNNVALLNAPYLRDPMTEYERAKNSQPLPPPPEWGRQLGEQIKKSLEQPAQTPTPPEGRSPLVGLN